MTKNAICCRYTEISYLCSIRDIMENWTLQMKSSFCQQITWFPFSEFIVMTHLNQTESFLHVRTATFSSFPNPYETLVSSSPPSNPLCTGFLSVSARCVPATCESSAFSHLVTFQSSRPFLGASSSCRCGRSRNTVRTSRTLLRGSGVRSRRVGDPTG